MEAVGVLFGQECQKQQQCSLGVWVDSEERQYREDWLPSPSCPRLTEPCCSSPPHTLPTTATLTWWDLTVSLNEAADTQELRSHIDNLWEKKGQFG